MPLELKSSSIRPFSTMETNWCGWYSISSYAGQLAEHLPQRMHFLGFTPEMRVTVSIMF